MKCCNLEEMQIWFRDGWPHTVTGLGRCTHGSIDEPAKIHNEYINDIIQMYLIC